MTPPMQGFVTAYIANFPLGDTTGGAGPTYQQYQPIMQCFPPTSVPVLAILAEQFAVFDHWFCSVPSQTWCNRAFWNAGTSWGHGVNGGAADENSVSTSFLKTMFEKRSSYLTGPLTARDGAASDFSEVFTASAPRDVSSWPDIPKPQIPPGLWAIDFSGSRSTTCSAP